MHTTPQYPSTPLLPSAALPSPITPLFTNDSSFRIATASETRIPFGGSLVDISLASLCSDHSFPCLRQPKHVAMLQFQCIERAMEVLLDELHFSSVAEFFLLYIQQIPHKDTESFGDQHCRTLKVFLQGHTKVKPIEIVEKLYHHRYSYPSYKSIHKQEQSSLCFHPSFPPKDIAYARPSISTWATQLVGKHVKKSVRDLRHDPEIPNSLSDRVPVRLAAAANDNAKAKGVCTVTKDDLMSFQFSNCAKLFRMRSPLVWYLTKCMAVPKKNGVLAVRKWRNPETIQTSAIASFVLSGNQYANGYMAMHMGIWHTACGSHVDVKRAYSHLASSMHETTARCALETMADDSLENLWTEVKTGEKRYQVLYQYVLDNIQEFVQVWEGGVGLENPIGLEDCEPNAFDFVDCFMHILKNECAELTVEKLYQSISWIHIHVKFAIHQMREGRKTKVVPLGCNAEHEIETSGMIRALLNFFQQAGLLPEYAASLIAWVGGDGSSVIVIDTAKKYSAMMYDPEDTEYDYRNLHNVMSTLGIWHTQSTMQNSIAANHYGPLVTSDPSSLSQSGACAGFKWPTNFKDCNRYMTPAAYKQALSEILNNSAPDYLKFPIGEQYSSRRTASTSQKVEEDAEETKPVGKSSKSKEKKPAVHVEENGFTGDRVLANSILFMMEYSWWIEAAYAIPEGDIGQVWEIMKIWILLLLVPVTLTMSTCSSRCTACSNMRVVKISRMPYGIIG
ncbi:hypothetical protein BT96DRAFT_960505 [Gymnopus androsaceus JB14]|uniref:DUF6589 domain-containing protein n=1 Tax=Gymnopus androsaceus JB14 TaxID=1447944 RepID=A0A6A4GM97_9AGAR|nr:hypothetical protein BT96DRAFT_960505 [Gymnopus androsaceus JB14]